jgi:hypothetical protein
MCGLGGGGGLDRVVKYRGRDKIPKIDLSGGSNAREKEPCAAPRQPSRYWVEVFAHPLES